MKDLDELESEIIDQLRIILHDDHLESQQEPRCQVLLSVWVSSAKRQEIWFINEQGMWANDRLSTPEEKKRIMEANISRGAYDPVVISIKLRTPREEEGRVVWDFEAGEVAGGMAGGDSKGTIVYDRQQERFSFRGAMQVLIA